MAIAKLALRTMPGSTARRWPRCCRRWATTTSSCSIWAPTPNAMRATSSSSRSWARPIRASSPAATRRACGCSTSAPRKSRAPTSCAMQPAAQLKRGGRGALDLVRRLHRGRQAVPRRCRRGRDRRLFGQYRAEGGRRHGALRGRPAAAQLLQLAALEVRLPGLAPGDRTAASIISIPTTTTAPCSSASTASS
jgi:hypothetical protein